MKVQQDQILLNPADLFGRVFFVNDASTIANFLIETVKRHPRILGARLGAQLSAAMPGVKSIPGYKGLRQFIEDTCSEEIIRIETDGVDDSYVHVSMNPDASFIENHARMMEVGPRVWQTFQRPGDLGALLVNTETGDLRVQAVRGKPPAGYLQVPAVSTAEHRGIAEKYAQLHPDNSELQEALGQDEYWPYWIKAVKKLPHSKLWSQFRVEQLTSIFRERMKALGLEGTVQEIATENLLAAKGKERLAASGKNRVRGQLDEQLCPPNHADSIRDLVHRVVDLMSESELKTLKLPVGDVIEILRGRRI